MDTKTIDGWLVAAFRVILLLIVFALGGIIGATGMEHVAVNKGHAVYCPHNGEFAWKGECEEDR